jgi:hypothetical protein
MPVRLDFVQKETGLVGTFLAMIVPVAICLTLLTVPPFPLPSSFNTSRSSLFRSSLYSTPISSCCVFPASSSISLLSRMVLSSGSAGRGGGLFNARPLTFLRLSVRAPKASDMVKCVCGFCRYGPTQCKAIDGVSKLLQFNEIDGYFTVDKVGCETG